MFSRVIVCCPAGLVTGGAELLHQFVYMLQHKNVESKVLYYPFNDNNSIPKPYHHYDIDVASLNDVDSSTLIILPETGTHLAKYFDEKNIAIWWLSVDNYYGHPRNVAKFKDKIKHILKILLGKKLNLGNMRNMIHFHQSEYARIYLSSKGINSFLLSDYLNGNHTITKEKSISKSKFVCYNPKKGMDITNKIMQVMQDINFIPLIDMTPLEVRDTLEKSLIYIDFGNHPGKDRFPREAALANCIIITGRQGSADNQLDIPIPDKFKIKEDSPDFLIQVQSVIQEICSDFDSHHSIQDNYRKAIRDEYNNFENNVDGFIIKYIKK